MAFIDGNTLRLRGFLRDDLPAYRRWLATPEVNQYLEMGSRPLGETDLESIYKLSAETPTNYVFIMERADTGQPIGTVGIWDINWLARRGDFRIILGEPESMGQGFGSEALDLMMAFAFDHLNLHVLTLGFNAENKAAERTYTKAGFIFEGRRRQLLYRNGVHYDVVYMSMLRDEYRAARGGADS